MEEGGGGEEEPPQLATTRWLGEATGSGTTQGVGRVAHWAAPCCVCSDRDEPQCWSGIHPQQHPPPRLLAGARQSRHPQAAGALPLLSPYSLALHHQIRRPCRGHHSHWRAGAQQPGPGPRGRAARLGSCRCHLGRTRREEGVRVVGAVSATQTGRDFEQLAGSGMTGRSHPLGQLLASSEGRALAAWTQVQCLCHRRWDSAHGLTWNVKAWTAADSQ